MIKGVLNKHNKKASVNIPKIEFIDMIPAKVKRNNYTSGKIHVHHSYINKDVLVLILPEQNQKK